SPMMATALGQRSNAVRDVRRTFRAGLWLLAFMLPPYWLVLWHIGALMRVFGEAPELARQGQTFMRAYMWCTAPWLLFQLLRNFVSALERPRIVLWLSLVGIALNALLSWSLIFGHFGLHGFGLPGGGLGSTLTWLMLCAALVLVTVTDRRFRRFHLFGNWWRFDRQRTLALVPLGLGQAATVRVGLALGRSDEAGIARAGWTAWVMGVAFMGSMALVMWSIPRTLVTLFLTDAPKNAVTIA